MPMPLSKLLYESENTHFNSAGRIDFRVECEHTSPISNETLREKEVDRTMRYRRNDFLSEVHLKIICCHEREVKVMCLCHSIGTSFEYSYLGHFASVN